MRMLNYLELSVYRTDENAPGPTRGLAVVVSLGRDLFDSLEQAVVELRKEAWAVDDVKLFKTDVTFEQLSHDERLRRAHDRARAEGIDWFIDERVPVSQLTSG